MENENVPNELSTNKPHLNEEASVAKKEKIDQETDKQEYIQDCKIAGEGITDEEKSEVDDKVDSPAVEEQHDEKPKSAAPKKPLSPKGMAGIIIGAVIAVLAIIAIIIGVTSAVAAQQHEDELATYKSNLTSITSNMLTGAADSESAANLIKSVWRNTIYKESDSKTDKYTKIGRHFRSDFNDSLGELFNDPNFDAEISSIKSNKETVKKEFAELANPPEEYKEIYEAVCELYDAYFELVNCAIDPSGNLSSYSSTFSDADSATLKAYEKVKSLLDV